MVFNKLVSLLSRGEKTQFYWILLLLILSAVFESTGMALLIPYIYLLQNPDYLLRYQSISQLFNKFQLQDTPSIIVTTITLFFILFIFIRAVIQTYIFYVVAQFPYKVFERQSNLLLSKYLGMEFQKFSRENTSVFIKNIYVTVDLVAYTFLIYLQYVAALLITCALTGVILFENMMISLPLMSFFGVMGTSLYLLFKGRQRNAGTIRETEAGELHKQASEALNAFKEIRIYQRTSYFLAQYAKVAKKFAHASGHAVFYPLLPPVYIESAAISLLLLFVMAFTWNNVPLANLVPSLIFFGVVGRRLLPALNQCISLKVTLKRCEASLNILLHELENAEPSVPPYPLETKQTFSQSIEFRNVSFSYPNRIDVLKHVSFCIRKGESTAFVGPSGAGKTTLIELLTSLIKPSGGQFFIDGIEVPSLEAIRSQIGYVPQFISLIDDTIARNIAFGVEVIDTYKLQNAIKFVHLEPFIEHLPEGLNTIVGDRGMRISGGQRQRIGIARALYHDPELIIFDEVTASLDGQSENLLTDNILEVMKTKTLVMVTHRMNMIQKFNHIYVLQQGTIISTGKHQELMRTCNLFQALNQFIDDSNKIKI